jgi:hypothetical protein
MDWEKQDNELRSLMASSDFLPDGENWNAKEGWKKLQQKKQPAQRKRIPVWVRLAAAACAVGFCGGGIWYIQSTNSLTKSGKELVHQGSNPSMKTAKKRDGIKVVSGTEPLTGQAQNNNEVVHTKHQSGITGNENFIERQTVIQQDRKVGFKTGENRDTIETAEDGLAVELPAIKSGTKIDVVGPILPNELIPQTIVVVPAPTLKSKPRVVHYNQLGGMQSTPPPAFVLTKKSYAEIDAFAMQPLSNQKEPPFQLKIDISPAPKKSL